MQWHGELGHLTPDPCPFNPWGLWAGWKSFSPDGASCFKGTFWSLSNWSKRLLNIVLCVDNCNGYKAAGSGSVDFWSWSYNFFSGVLSLFSLIVTSFLSFFFLTPILLLPKTHPNSSFPNLKLWLWFVNYALTFSWEWKIQNSLTTAWASAALLTIGQRKLLKMNAFFVKYLRRRKKKKAWNS